MIVVGSLSGVMKWLGLYARNAPRNRCDAGAMELSAKIVDARCLPANRSLCGQEKGDNCRLSIIGGLFMTIFMRFLPGVFALLLVFPGAAEASGLAECRALADEGERLSCYDRLADGLRDSVPTVQPSPMMAPAGKADSGGSGSETMLASETAAKDHESLLGKAWELDPGQRGHGLRIRPYKPVYLLPLFRASSLNRRPSSPSEDHTVSDPLDLSANEAKLQFSLKTKIVEDVFGDNGDLWFGYTQSSRWQVYNGSTSRPFRESNYEPEFMFVWRTDYDLLGWRGRLVNLSLNHQSNGRSLPLSRSWNRLMLSTSLEYGNWTATLRPWWRLPESASKDDNPDISNYMGRADLQLVRTVGDHQLSLLLRHSLRTGENNRGAAQLDYAFPIAGDLRGHLQWFSGYGESMIDYNHRSNYFGVGVSLVEWY
jgi:phospholipase A1